MEYSSTGTTGWLCVLVIVDLVKCFSLVRSEVYKQLEKKFFEQKQRNPGESADHINAEVEARYCPVKFYTKCIKFYPFTLCTSYIYV